MGEQEGSSGGGVRFIVGVLLLGLLAFSGAVAYQKLSSGSSGSPQPDSAAQPDARLTGFLSAGYGHLDSGKLDAALEQFQKASGIADGNPAVHEGLCRTHMARAEASYLQLQAAPAGERRRLLKQLEQQVDRAREAIHAATASKPGSTAKSRLGYFERQLNTTLLLAYVQAGETERARGVLQARLQSHPDKQLLAKLIAQPGETAPPETSASASASASTSASASASSAPEASAAVAAKPPAGPHRSGHYELDHEPDVGHLAGPNELQLPGNAPAPSPAPAPHVDTSDL